MPAPIHCGKLTDETKRFSYRIDRVGCRGLRPGTLPHHRTCGFPHPAVGSSGNLPSQTTRPVESEHSDRLGACCPRPAVSQSRVATAVVRPCCFVRYLLFRPVLGLAPYVPSALGSSRLSPGLLATMASADFSSLLSEEISLGQCRACPCVPSGSACAVDDSWASRVLACSPAVARLTASSCSYGRRFACGPLGESLAVPTWPFGYGWRHHSVGDLSPREVRHLPGTRAPAHSGRGTGIVPPLNGNGCKTDGLEWDLLPLDFLRRIH